MAKDSLTITDNRTGKTYEVPITDGTIRALDLRQIKASADDFGLMTYDPAFTNTASCKSRITFIDGDKGILNYRGYPIEELAEKSNYLETAFLILYGELPTKDEYATWVHNITHHTMVHENIKELMGGFATTRTPWACSAPRWRRSRPSIPRPRTSTIPRSATTRSSGSSRRCPRWRPSPSATPWACPTPIPTTTSPTAATSCR